MSSNGRHQEDEQTSPNTSPIQSKVWAFCYQWKLPSRPIFSWPPTLSSLVLTPYQSPSKLHSTSMADVAGKSTSASAVAGAARRVACISNHLLPLASSAAAPQIARSNAAFDDSYHRVHGAVAAHPPAWRPAIDESGKAYTDIVYEKAVDEAIAKVHASPAILSVTVIRIGGVKAGAFSGSWF